MSNYPEGIYQFIYGQQTIEYTLEYKDRKTLGITVHPDKSIIVAAPINTAFDKIKNILKKRAVWILKQQNYFAQFEPRNLPKQFVSGETHRYLGKQYRLKVIEDPDLLSIKLQKGYFIINVPNRNDQSKIEALLYQWYKKRAQVHFKSLLNNCYLHFKLYNVSYPTLVIQKMKKRWGSCTPTGKIILNLDLIQAPKGCIEYVIYHELCHLVYPNHGVEFYSLLGKVYPKWKTWKDKMEILLG